MRAPTGRKSVVKVGIAVIDQLFFDVTAKNTAASWCTCLPPHFGHSILSFFVFCKGEDDFKWFLAIFADEFVARHGDPRMEKLIKEIVGVDGDCFNLHGLN